MWTTLKLNKTKQNAGLQPAVTPELIGRVFKVKSSKLLLLIKTNCSVTHVNLAQM